MDNCLKKPDHKTEQQHLAIFGKMICEAVTLKDVYSLLFIFELTVARSRLCEYSMLFEALPCSLVRVFSDHLDPTKTWYLYEKVWQVPRRKIKDSAIHKAFPCEFAFDMDVSVLLGEGGSLLSIDPASCKARGKIDVTSSFSFSVQH